MITLQEAYRIVTGSAVALPAEPTALDAALHRVLAEEVVSDMDMPPFDKSAMDGYACRREDLADILEIIETLPAGVLPSKEIGPLQCARIMTGSRLPEGADCVIRVEDTAMAGETRVRFTGRESAPNICYRGEDIRKGEPVLPKGTLVQAAQVAVLASVGCTAPRVFQRPRTGILSTGDELVEPDERPGEAGIRNSNASQLSAQMAEIGITAGYYGISADTREDLTRLITLAAGANDLILLTGGVSMGDYDLVPPVLADLGFEILFRKIAVQPGSPTLFALRDGTYCFGLPGNPVSSFVQFEMLVKPLIYGLMGHHYQPGKLDLPLGKAWKRRNADRTALVPVRVEEGIALAVEYHGSAHIHAYTGANGFMEVAPGTLTMEKGEKVHVRLL